MSTGEEDRRFTAVFEPRPTGVSARHPRLPKRHGDPEDEDRNERDDDSDVGLTR